MKRLIAVLLLTTLAFLTGCAAQAPRFQVNVDGMASSSAPDGKRYVLLPGNKDTRSEDLQFQEFSAYVHRALSGSGYTLASGLDSADLAIFIVYGIGAPERHQYSYSMPIWGQTGVSSSTTTGTVSSYGSFSANTTYTPTYGVKGFANESGEYVTYYRYLVIDAYDAPRSKLEQKAVPAWRTSVDSTGSSGDLRLVFPILVAASREYIGHNTGHRVEISLREADKSVQAIKGVQPAGKP